jgi:hypothetical protein
VLGSKRLTGEALPNRGMKAAGALIKVLVSIYFYTALG